MCFFRFLFHRKDYIRLRRPENAAGSEVEESEEQRALSNSPQSFHSDNSESLCRNSASVDINRDVQPANEDTVLNSNLNFVQKFHLSREKSSRMLMGRKITARAAGKGCTMFADFQVKFSVLFQYFIFYLGTAPVSFQLR